MVGARDLLLGELVEAQGEALGAAAAVDEDDRRAVLADELEQLRVDRRPDRLAGHVAALGDTEVGRRRLLGLDHRLDRHVDLEVERLADPGVDDPRGAPRADQEAPDLLERVLRGAEADALRVVLCELGQALERERQVRPALGRGHGVDLVDDHRLDAAQHLARLRGEHQVERLGRRDQDVRRRAAHRGALGLRRVAGADRDRHVRPDPAQRRAQVAVDVVGERLQRRDVDEARVGRRFARERVEAPQEGGERLAAARRRGDEHVVAGRDRRPCLRLRRGGRLERALEPVADGGGERRQRQRSSEGTRRGSPPGCGEPHLGPLALGAVPEEVVHPGLLGAGVGLASAPPGARSPLIAGGRERRTEGKGPIARGRATACVCPPSAASLCAVRACFVTGAWLRAAKASI